MSYGTLVSRLNSSKLLHSHCDCYNAGVYLYYAHSPLPTIVSRSLLPTDCIYPSST